MPAETALALFRDDDQDIQKRSRSLEQYPTELVLEAALQTFGRDAVISTAFGPSGLCLIHLAQQVDPDVRVYHIDTGFAFSETEALIQRYRTERQLKLRSILPVLTPAEQSDEHGPELWKTDPDRCCAIRKVEPNERALDGARLWITALRRDQSKGRAHTPMLQRVTLPSGHTLLKLAPMVEWTQRDVWRHIFAYELPYNPLHDRGYVSIGCTHCTHATQGKGAERDGRWRGRNKDECGLHVA